jgi:tetratricopeptide (TPR) repeat protein
MENSVVRNTLEGVYPLVRQGDLPAACRELESLLAVDYDNREVIDALKNCRYWLERFQQLEDFEDPVIQGDYLLEQWLKYLPEKGNDSWKNSALDLFSLGVHTMAARFFLRALDHLHPEPALFYRLGICSKALGDFEGAIGYFEKALGGNREDPDIIALMADTYSLINDEKISKILFREAFFIDPSRIEIKRLESPLINRLVEYLQGLGYKGGELKEWIPVYGVLQQVFNVRREISPLDFGKLRQSIMTMKNRLKENGDRKILVPRLVNHYFWLIDYYLMNNQQRSLIDEALMNINLLEPEIYRLYTK